MQVLTSPSHTEPLRWVEVPDRPLRKHEVRVTVRAASVNPVDWKMRQGDLLGKLQRVLGPRGPLVVGVDFAGDVTAVGAAVSDVKVGDRVVGGTDFTRGQHGSYAKEVQVRADQVAVLPAGVAYEGAACLQVAGVTARRALLKARLPEQTDGRALVLGASGGVGHIAVQLARACGAKAVGVCSARNVELVRRLGAVPIDYGKGDVAAAAAAEGPYDVIVDTVGTATYPLAMGRKLLKPGGRHVLVMPRPSDYLHVLLPGPVVTLLVPPRRPDLAALAAQLETGELRIVIEARFPFDQAEEAQRVSRGGKVVGKLVLVA